MFAEPPYLNILFGLIILAVLTFAFVTSAVRAFATAKPKWLISAFGSGILVTGLLGYATLQIGKGAVGRDLQVQDSRVFKSEDGLSAITGPFSWAEIFVGPDDASLKVGNPTDREFLVVISEPRSDFPEGYTLRNYAAAAIQSVSNALTEVKTTEFDEFQLNGLNALRNEMSGYNLDVSMDYLNTFVEGKKHFHQIRGWTPSKNRTAAFPLLRKVANTFHELPK